MAGRPPCGAVGMSGFGDEDVAKSTGVFRILEVIKLQSIHVLAIEEERSLAPIDLDSDVVLASVSKAGGFEVRNRAILETTNPGNCIIHGHVPQLLPGPGAKSLANFFED